MPLCWGMDPFTVVAMNASTMFAICKMRSCASLELGQKRLSADKGPSPDEGSAVDGSMSELLESPLRCTCHEIFEGQASTWGFKIGVQCYYEAWELGFASRCEHGLQEALGYGDTAASSA